ncbi:glycosyltransferase family 4 protein, partial [Citrobacter portucalensis]|uniref:glycosyltransferase family 4 protein n=1 Tax=Citrobacter portucalensis TaxID=1639133 RepID=UPI00226B30CE
VKYLCNEIYPELLKRDDGFELYVVGKNPPVEIEENSGLIKTGYVDDVMEYYSMCSAFVCPLRFGAGMKNKVLEAMSCGIPIVSSDVGVEGILGVEDGSNFILSSNLHQYVDAILKLKNDKEFSKSLGGNARKLISEKYKWDSISATYMDVLYSISDK